MTQEPSYKKTKAALLKKLEEDNISQKDFCEKHLKGQNKGDFSSWKTGNRANAALTQRIHDWLQKEEAKAKNNKVTTKAKAKQKPKDATSLVEVKVKKEPGVDEGKTGKGAVSKIKKENEVVMKPSKIAEFGYVYIMHSKRRAELKIGRAFDPNERLSHARVWDDSLTVADTFPFEDYKAAEYYVHSLLGNYREKNTEWFHCELDVARVACGICRKVQDHMKMKRTRKVAGVK